jgi:two-component system LytT family response regulator
LLRVVIVDDEASSTRTLVGLLADHPKIEIAGIASTAAEARSLIADVRPDVAFLDVELDAESGFDLVGGPDRPPQVVFVTAHPGHAVEAFSVEAADFLVKPIDPGRLAETVRRLEKRRTLPGADVPIELRMPGRSLLVPPSDIVAFRAEDDFTRVSLADGSSVLILRTLGQFDALAPRPMFERLDRSIILNLDRVRRIVMKNRNSGSVTVEGLDTPILLGRTALSRLRAALSSRE